MSCQIALTGKIAREAIPGGLSALRVTSVWRLAFHSYG